MPVKPFGKAAVLSGFTVYSSWISGTGERIKVINIKKQESAPEGILQLIEGPAVDSSTGHITDDSRSVYSQLLLAANL